MPIYARGVVICRRRNYAKAGLRRGNHPSPGGGASHNRKVADKRGGRTKCRHDLRARDQSQACSHCHRIAGVDRDSNDQRSAGCRRRRPRKENQNSTKRGSLNPGPRRPDHGIAALSPANVRESLNLLPEKIPLLLGNRRLQTFKHLEHVFPDLAFFRGSLISKQIGGMVGD